MSRRIAALVFALVSISTSRAAVAQLAPTGAQYAGRPSDTGFAGAVVAGGYATSIPFDFPAPRAGLPLPLTVMFGARGFGAAGVGWDLPIAFVQQDNAFAHRRPAPLSDSVLSLRESLVVTLPGRRLEMVHKGTDYVARDGAPDVRMRNVSGAWKLFDGDGRTWSFTQDSRLAPAGMWLLDSVREPSGNAVVLTYAISTPTLPGSTLPAIAIDLVKVSYDASPTTTGCFKHEINLVYDPASSTPLALGVVGQRALTRLHKLTSVAVTSRSACGTATQTLRTYTLGYAADPDTQLMRLSSVMMSGRQGTPEASVSLPVASYSYGTATYPIDSTHRELRYQTVTQPITLPNGAGTDGIAREGYEPSFHAPISNAGQGSATWQNLIDLTGDGRPDFVFVASGQPSVARNVPAAGGATVFAAAAPIYDATLTSGWLDMRSAQKPRFSPAGSDGVVNIDYIWRQAIDVNGDGRLDLVDASIEPGHWVIFVNTPDPGPSGIKWLRRSVDIRPLYQRFVDRQHHVQGGYLPLSRRFTGKDWGQYMCWQWDYTNKVYKKYPGGLNYVDGCFTGGYPPPYSGPEQTYVEWELTDVNGDGYPDVVLNSSPVEFVEDRPPQTFTNQYVLGDLVTRARPLDVGNRIEAAINVRGLFMSSDTTGSDFSTFSAPTTLKTTICGVAKWIDQSMPYERQVTACDLVDANGDGILDRYENEATDPAGQHYVTLGTGVGFSGARFSLPGELTAQVSEAPQKCTQGVPGGTPFSSRTIGALRDLTGDGIPDYAAQDPTTLASQVWIGTGAGFAPPIPVENGLTISLENEECDGYISLTRSGVYDIDGDGLPDLVGIGGTGLVVAQLAGGTTPRTPEAGRIVRIDNGYGAVTAIGYRSAKEDGTTAHQIPSPEIVPTRVDTSGSLGLGGTLSSRRYAYGGAQTYYDPSRDLFVFPGYQRTVEMRVITDTGDAKTTGNVVLVDAYPLTPWSSTMTQNERYGRYLRVGRTSDVTVLNGSVGNDPWALLADNLPSDVRRRAATHFTWDTRTFPEPAPSTENDLCYDVMYPYDFDSTALGFGSSSYDSCSVHGFIYAQAETSWRGSAAPPSTSNVSSGAYVRAIDNLGRVGSMVYQNDLYRGDDDVCVDTSFAAPTGTDAQVLSAPATRKTWDCSKGGVWAAESFEYDQLAQGNVAAGLITGHVVERHDATDGALLAVIRAFDAQYDAAGNPTQLTRVREDGAKQTTTLAYDPFGLAVTSETIAASSGPSLTRTVTLDPISLDRLAEVDANGSARGATFDGFGRPLSSTVQPAGGALGATRSFSYLGFTGNDPLGRRVAVKDLTDAVAPANLAGAAGRVRTTYLDELGRARMTQLQLGSDYGNEVLIIGARTYDGLGHVAFEADPYPASQAGNTAYGTTYYFADDGSPRVFIRGSGPQPLTTIPDATIERFPTLYTHTFANNQESMSMQDAASLTSTSPQAGVVTAEITSAIGRALFRSTWKSGVRLEHAGFGYDRLGHLTSMVRYGDPVNAANAVQSSWRVDSLGQTISIQEPDAAPETLSYSNWGELDRVTWTPPSPEPPHVVSHTYDALSRLIHSEEQNGGVTDADTVYDYSYDVGVTVSPQVDPRFVLGRLARATSPTGAVAFSYDPFGRVAARTYTDGNGVAYVEQHAWHDDGSDAHVELDLPDDSYKAERVDYGYDSAGRPRSMLYGDGTSTQTLYTASGVDAFGRLRKGQVGPNLYYGDFADVGRRLPKSWSVSTPLGSRTTTFKGYDPVGRELSRTETGPVGGATNITYDALGRIASMTKSGSPSASWTFGYDALGNATALNDLVGSADAAMSYLTTDRDRLCRIGYGNNGLGGTTCNVAYDSFGNVASQPTRTGGRKLGYFNAGSVRTIDESGGSSARFHYDAFGNAQQLDVTGTSYKRSEQRFGSMITQRYEVNPNGKAYYLQRRFVGPGVVITRRGAGGPWNYAFAEQRGMRVATDDGGNFVQDVGYQPFGEATSVGAGITSTQYSAEQWNDGDTLAPFGVTHVGARLYDPVIGRFTGRDPLLVPRTAATTNPYAFAMNDPWNASDPTGLDTESPTGPPQPLPPISWWGGGGAGGKPHGKPKPKGLTDEEIDKRLRGIAITDRGRAYQLYVQIALGHDEDGEFMDDLAQHCGEDVDCVVNAVENSVLSENDRAYNERVDAMTPIVQRMFVGGTLPLPVAFLYEMSQASNENEIVIPMLTFGVGQFAGGEGSCAGDTCGANPNDPQCFTAGTPVATDSGPTPIETVRPGDRVRSLDASRCTEPVDPGDCKTVSVEIQDPFGYSDTLTAEFMRPASWLAEHHVAVGAEVPLAVDELKLDGRARVTGVRECAIQPGSGCVVSGTISHLNRSVLRLRFDESAQPLEATTLHELWSIDRDGWVRAGELSVGERLRTRDGAVTIAAIERLPGAHRVYNFEVAGAHTYLAGEAEVESHNANCLGPKLEPYSEGGGHHIPAKSAFNGEPSYDIGDAPAIPDAELDRLGINHGTVSGAQQTLYREFAKTGKALTWDAAAKIETQALVAGSNLTPAVARGVVDRCINALKKQGVAGPTRIPWSKP